MTALKSMQASPTATAGFDAKRAAPAVPANAKDAQVTKAAKQFEAQFLSQMLGHMFEGVKTDGFFGGGNGEDMFRSLMIDEYGKMIANRGNGIGIATAMKSQLLRQQEVH